MARSIARQNISIDVSKDRISPNARALLVTNVIPGRADKVQGARRVSRRLRGKIQGRGEICSS